MHPIAPFGAQQVLLGIELRANHHAPFLVQTLVAGPHIAMAVMRSKVADGAVAETMVRSQLGRAAGDLHRLAGKILAKNQRSIGRETQTKLRQKIAPTAGIQSGVINAANQACDSRIGAQHWLTRHGNGSPSLVDEM